MDVLLPFRIRLVGFPVPQSVSSIGAVPGAVVVVVVVVDTNGSEIVEVTAAS